MRRLMLGTAAVLTMACESVPARESMTLFEAASNQRPGVVELTDVWIESADGVHYPILFWTIGGTPSLLPGK